MAKNDIWEIPVKVEQAVSLDPFSMGAQQAPRRMAEVHRVLGDPRVSVGLPVRDELSAASNLLVNKAQ